MWYVTAPLPLPSPRHVRYRTFIQAVDTEPPPVDVAAFEQVRRSQHSQPQSVACWGASQECRCILLGCSSLQCSVHPAMTCQAASDAGSTCLHVDCLTWPGLAAVLNKCNIKARHPHLQPSTDCYGAVGVVSASILLPLYHTHTHTHTHAGAVDRPGRPGAGPGQLTPEQAAGAGSAPGIPAGGVLGQPSRGYGWSWGWQQHA